MIKKISIFLLFAAFTVFLGQNVLNAQIVQIEEIQFSGHVSVGKDFSTGSTGNINLGSPTKPSNTSSLANGEGLPYSLVLKILAKAAPILQIQYTTLVQKYNAGEVTITQIGPGKYLVKVANGGIAIIVVEAN